MLTGQESTPGTAVNRGALTSVDRTVVAMTALDERPARAPARAQPVEVFELTCATTGRAHLAAVWAVEEAIDAEQGWFPALCGARVLASSLASPPGAACFACRDSGVPWRHAGRRGERR